MNRLRHLRKRNKFTLNDIAKQLNLSTTQVYKLERHQSELKEKYIVFFCYLYKCTPNYLLGLDDDDRIVEIKEMKLQLKEIRKAKKLKQKDLTQILNIKKQQAHLYENNQSQLTESQIKILCEHLETNANYLLGLKEKENKI